MGKLTGKELSIIAHCCAQRECRTCKYYTEGCSVKVNNEYYPCTHKEARKAAIVQLFAEHLRYVADIKSLADECVKHENCYSCPLRNESVCAEFFQKHKKSPENYYNEVR